MNLSGLQRLDTRTVPSREFMDEVREKRAAYSMRWTAVLLGVSFAVLMAVLYLLLGWALGIE